MIGLTPRRCAELVEAHWSYMDRYAAELIARGPTFGRGGPGGREGGNRYLVLGLGSGQAADLDPPPAAGQLDELIAYGPLLSDDGTAWLGTALLVRAPDPDAARALLTPDRYAGIEVHDWEFGGRR
ncbi:hypothetical protein [Nonomuraea sp. NPDC005501]|uniref:hypothetical protein n=1 Tax=Nonomuraea sp. NPDC005501 TaxID=3156884 RepID=UPI0033AF3D55